MAMQTQRSEPATFVESNVSINPPARQKWAAQDAVRWRFDFPHQEYQNPPRLAHMPLR
jgi:hypothetical protein